MKKFIITTILILSTIASVFAQRQYPEEYEETEHYEKVTCALSGDVNLIQQIEEEAALENVDLLLPTLQKVPGNDGCVFYYTTGVRVARYTYGRKLPEWFVFNGDKGKMNFVLEELRTRKGGWFNRSRLNSEVSLNFYMLLMLPISYTSDCMLIEMSIEIEAFKPEELKDWEKYIKDRGLVEYRSK